jgi:hypothetical protein
MKVEKQVCTLKQGERLEELGINVKPLFCYCRVSTSVEDSYDDLLPTEWNLEGLPELATTWQAPAFTVSELGKMLGKGTKAAEVHWQWLLDCVNSGLSGTVAYNAVAPTIHVRNLTCNGEVRTMVLCSRVDIVDTAILLSFTFILNYPLPLPFKHCLHHVSISSCTEAVAC